MATWRKHPFFAGQIYLAAECFVGFPNSEFIKDEAYEFAYADYSRYESSTVFTFRRKSSIEPTYWWWGDDEPDDSA